MLGFFVARIATAYVPSLDEEVPTLERWHPSLVRYETWSRRWIARTNDGDFTIVESDGRVAEGWLVSFVGDRTKSYMEGAIRAVGEPFLSAQFAARDARRHSERMGQGIVEAQVPGTQAETSEAKRYLSALARVGSSGVIVSPQYESAVGLGGSSGVSYGLKMHFPPASGMDGLLALDRSEGSKIRRRILGQDTTSVDSKGGGFARAAVGDRVRQEMIEADAHALDGVATALLDAWSLYDARPRRLYPDACWDSTPPEDAAQTAATRSQSAMAMATVAGALPGLIQVALGAGTEIDVPALLASYGVPLREATAE